MNLADMYAYLETDKMGLFFVIVGDNGFSNYLEAVILPNLDNLIIPYEEADRLLEDELIELVDTVPENVLVYLVNEFDINKEKYTKVLEKFDALVD